MRVLTLGAAFPTFVSGKWRQGYPLTVAGAVTELAPYGRAAPCSLFILPTLRAGQEPKPGGG
jgi:hypothetical protein